MYLIVAELLAERGQQVAQLSRRDETIAVLVEMAQPLNEIVSGVAAASLRDCLNMYTHILINKLHYSRNRQLLAIIVYNSRDNECDNIKTKLGFVLYGLQCQ